MPWKTWAYMERVTSPDFQSYLQDQVVAKFTSTAQRDSQWPTPSRGSRCITTDTNTTWLHDGTQWLPMPGTMRGLILTGTQVNAPATNSVLPLTTVVSGPASWLAANTITIPAGAGGLYLVQLALGVRSDSVVAIGANVKNNAGQDFNPGMSIYMSYAVSTAQSITHGSWIRAFPDGQTLRVYWVGNPPTNASVQTLSILRVGDTFPSALTQPALPEQPITGQPKDTTTEGTTP